MHNQRDRFDHFLSLVRGRKTLQDTFFHSWNSDEDCFLSQIQIHTKVYTQYQGCPWDLPWGAKTIYIAWILQNCLCINDHYLYFFSFWAFRNIYCGQMLEIVKFKLMKIKKDYIYKYKGNSHFSIIIGNRAQLKQWSIYTIEVFLIPWSLLLLFLFKINFIKV